MDVIHFPNWDTELFIIINGFHFDWLDPIMKIFSSIKIWIFLYLTIISIICWNKRIWSIATLAVLAVSFTLADQLSVHLFKNVFERLRPCHLEELRTVIHSLEDCGGKYGFISNHAANSFCFAMFTAWFFKNKYCTILIFFWAICVSYSRIYVGKHFPLDVICGAVFGIVCLQTGLLLYKGLQWAVLKITGFAMPDIRS
jgi:undecaprenyl-diphosphatase